MAKREIKIPERIVPSKSPVWKHDTVVSLACLATGGPHKWGVWSFVWNIKKCVEEYWRALYRKLISRNGQVKAQDKCKPTSIVVCCRFCGSTWRIWAILWVLRWLLLYVIFNILPYISLYFKQTRLAACVGLLWSSNCLISIIPTCTESNLASVWWVTNKFYKLALNVHVLTSTLHSLKILFWILHSGRLYLRIFMKTLTIFSYKL